MEDVVPLREYIEAMFQEKHQATVVAEQEREKTRSVAEEEREKAAQARKAEFDNRIVEVDRHLRQHINTQIDQVNSDRTASVKLLESMIDSLRREALLIHNASEQAIKKAEEQNLAWRAQANEWRGQSADREASQEAQRAKLEATFLPRESFDKVSEGWDAWRAEISQRINQQQGAATQTLRAQDRAQPWQIWLAGALLAILIIAANLVIAVAL